MITRASLSGAVVAMLIIATAPVFAQRGRPAVPPGQAKKGQQAPSTSSSLVTGGADIIGLDNTRVRALGAWLDDASVLPPGETWVAVSASKWALPVATGADAPVIDLSVGVTERVQASVSVPYFRAAPTSGETLRGVGDIYVTTKVVLREATDDGGVGLAIAPTAEILSRSSIVDTSSRRVNWVLPLNLERRFTTGRVYGSTGWFSRGAFFVSAALERYVTDAFSLSAAATHSSSTDDSALSGELGLGRRRLDVSGTAVYSVSPAMAVFASLGRTVWGRDADSTRVIASGGVSMKVR